MLRILQKMHVESHGTNCKAGSGSEKNHYRSTTLVESASKRIEGTVTGAATKRYLSGNIDSKINKLE